MAVQQVVFQLTPTTSENFEASGYKAYLPGDRFADKRTLHRFSDTEFRQVHNMFTQWSTTGIRDETVFDNFNRWYTIFPDMEMPADLKSYVFITRPELNLVDGDKSYSASGSGGLNADNYLDSRLQYLAAMNPEIMYMLGSSYTPTHDFISYLQGRTESLQIPDYQIRTQDFAIPFYNYRYTYPTVANESITGGTFEITFREDEDLRITKMFQFWIYYMDSIVKNRMKPSKTHIYGNFYDFMCSVYEFVCDPTSKRILFWVKYTGCYPTSVPLSVFSHNLHNNVDNKIGITFNYIMVEAMDPRVITDFNQNTANHPSGRVPIYNTDFGVVGDTLVGCPVVSLTPDKHGLMLEWTRAETISKTGRITKNTPTLTNIMRAINNVKTVTGTSSGGTNQ